MARYTVNATLEVGAWITVEADSEEAAYLEARDRSPRDFDYDMATARVEFNVYPIAEVEA